MPDENTETPSPDPAPGTAPAAPETPPPVEETPVPGSEALGDPGKKALDAMKGERNDARKTARALEEENARLKAAAEGREAEWEAERKAKAAQEEKFRSKYLNAEVKAAAKGVLSDPADAMKFLDLSGIEVSDEGDVDADAITAALTELVTSKPYLAVQDGGRFTGSADPGARNAGPQQITEDQLQNMTTAEIEAARKEGRLDKILGKT